MDYAREGEFSQDHPRSDRFVEVHGKWFFMTRERTMEGPFVSHTAAQIGAIEYGAACNGRSAVETIELTLPGPFHGGTGRGQSGAI